MLYRKYRPQSFSEVVGQAHVVGSLQGGLTGGRIGHAYLFTGPRGTGKTTLARIFAKSLNCQKRKTNGDPCNSCDFCNSVNLGNSLDLIEIDAASQTGVDNIRELTDSTHTAAPGGGYKVFLVDEVHMLSKSAFNALLKTLEEPPAHVIFILATTEPHKILPTVLSRVQRFDFKRLTNAEIFQKLQSIAKSEKIKISDEGLGAIAASADGALRDAEVMLTKVVTTSADKNISTEEVHEILGLIPHNFYPEFFGHLVSKNSEAALGFIQTIYHSGIDVDHFSKGLLEYMRRMLVAKVSPATLVSAEGDWYKQDPGLKYPIDQKGLIRMIQIFTNARAQIKSSPIPPLPLELAVLEFVSN